MLRKLVAAFLILSAVIPVIALVVGLAWAVIAGDWSNAIPAGVILWLLAISAAFTYYVATDETNGTDIW